jgi:cysteine desulfurase
MTYLDWAATSPPDAEILAAAAREASAAFGNPSSRHALGLEARERLELARSRLAAALAGGGATAPRGGAAAGRIAFTSGGTEADAAPLLAVLRSALTARRGGEMKELRILTTGIEHAAVFEEARVLESLGLALDIVNPGPDGLVDPARIAEAVRKDTALVAVMAVNNETGAIQDLAAVSRAVAEAARASGRKSPRVHADAVQALGKVPFSPAGLGLSSAAFSAHKIRGPRGSGALWLDGSFEGIAAGGGQEGGVRPGTENLQGAWGFAAAAESAVAALGRNRELALALEARLLDGLAAIGGAAPLPLGRRAGDPRYSPFILSVAFPGLSGEVMVRGLSDAGVAVSTGSACSSNSKRAGRRVLEAMGLESALAQCAIRVSTGELSTTGDVDRFLEAASDTYARLRT